MEGLNEYKTKTGDKNPNFEEKRPNTHTHKKTLQEELKVFKPDLKKNKKQENIHTVVFIKIYCPLLISPLMIFGQISRSLLSVVKSLCSHGVLYIYNLYYF